MNRRGFLKFLGAAAAAEIIPNGRVWFIPQKVELYTMEHYPEHRNIQMLPRPNRFVVYYDVRAIENLRRSLRYEI